MNDEKPTRDDLLRAMFRIQYITRAQRHERYGVKPDEEKAQWKARVYQVGEIANQMLAGAMYRPPEWLLALPDVGFGTPPTGSEENALHAEVACYRKALETIISKSDDPEAVAVAHEAITPYTPWSKATPEQEAAINASVITPQHGQSQEGE